MQWLLIFTFGGVGALVRFLFSTHLNSPGFPYGTLAVNVLGSFLIGYLVAGQALVMSPAVKLALVAGFLGALTTFSSYSLELVSLVEKGKVSVALLYFFLSQGLGVGCCLLGFRLGRIAT